MTHRTADYLDEAARYSRRGWEKGKDLSRHASESIAGASRGTLIAGLAAFGLVAGLAFFGSDLIRYIKMRRM